MAHTFHGCKVWLTQLFRPEGEGRGGGGGGVRFVLFFCVFFGEGEDEKRILSTIFMLKL